MKLPIYALLGITSLTLACGGDDGEKVESSQIHAIVAQNTENAVNSTLNNADFLESSDLIEKIFGATGETCTLSTDGQEADCQPRELNLDFDAVRLKRSDVADYLRQTVFQDANVESSSDTEVTYLISGESLCGEADPMFPSDCISEVNKAQLRLRVTSPEADAVDIDLLVGPDQDNPVSAEFHSDLLGVEVDLDGIENSLAYLESQGLVDDEIDLPATFKGRVRAEVKVENAQKIQGSVSVLRDLDLAGGDFGLKIGANEPTFSVTLDGAAEVITVLADLGKTDLRVQEEGQTWELSLAGLDGQAALSAQTDSILFIGMGLGDEQSTMKIDGEQVLSFDLNADSGRHIGLLASPTADGVKLDFDAALKIALGLSIDDEESPAYLQDDVLTFELQGDSPSIIVEGGDLVEVVEGKLKLSLEKAGQSLEVEAGQCMTSIVQDDVQEGDIEEGTIVEEMEIIACE